MKVLSTVGAMTAFASCVSAFITPFSVSRVASPLRMSDTAASEQYSTALPWVKQPKNLDGMAGNFGFDPLGLATIFDAKCLQEGELKNGRVAMLAFVGYLVSQVVHLPGPMFQSDNPLDAMAAVGPIPMTIIFFLCGALEWYFHNGKMIQTTMFDDGQEPGNYGFDPLELSTNPDDLEKYKVQEVKHGRLAMIAMIVLMRQSAVLHAGVPFHAGGIPFIT